MIPSPFIIVGAVMAACVIALVLLSAAGVPPSHPEPAGHYSPEQELPGRGHQARERLSFVRRLCDSGAFEHVEVLTQEDDHTTTAHLFTPSDLTTKEGQARLACVLPRAYRIVGTTARSWTRRP